MALPRRPSTQRGDARSEQALAPEAPAPPETTQPRGEQGDLLGAALRRWWVVVLVPLTLVGVALVLSGNRPPKHTAEARLIVGGVAVQAQSVPGFVSATLSLAETYSRAVGASEVIDPLARSLRLSPKVVRERLAAAPIPESSVIEIKGSGPSEREAIALANGATRALVDYAAQLNSPRSGAGLLRRYKAAARKASRDSQEVRAARARVLLEPTRRARDGLAAATASLQTTRLRVQALAEGYRINRAAITSAPVTVLTRATQATSDAASIRQRLVFVAAVGGLVVGLGLAVALDAVACRRRGRRQPA